MTCCLHTVSVSVSPNVPHTPVHVISCFTYFGRAASLYHLLAPTANFSWLIAIIATYYFVAIVYIMASQDLISQFSQDTNAIPASQPDRSRTPHRPPTWLAPNGTYVSRTDALCNDDPSSFLAACWHTSSTTDVYIVLITPNMDSAYTTFPTYTADVLLNSLSTTPISHLNDILLPRDRRDPCHPLEEALPSMKATPVAPLKSHRWNNGNLTLTSMTPTRSMGTLTQPLQCDLQRLSCKTQ